MQIEEPVRGTTEKRTVRWLFEELWYALVEPSLPGRTPDSPQGKLTLTLNANPTIQGALLRFADVILRNVRVH
jgi:hypothetical protein